MLAEDGYTLAPNQPPIVGCAGWLALFRPQLTQGKWRIDNVAESVVAYGPLAVERGRFVLSFTPPPGAPSSMRAISDTAKYLWHWRKFHGQWQLDQAAWECESTSAAVGTCGTLPPNNACSSQPFAFARSARSIAAAAADAQR